MKYLTLLAVTLTLAGCLSTNKPSMHQLPKGYKACHSEADCNHQAGEYCGFVGVDTPAVCVGGQW